MIGLYRGKSLTSWGIKWFSWSSYSHASWILSDGSVIEAWHRGGVRHVKNWNMNHRRGTKINVYRIKGITPEQTRAIEDFLRSQVGKKYYFWGIMRFLSRRRNRRRTRAPADVNRWFCSELVFEACRQAGITLLANVEAHQVTPGMLAQSPLLEFVETRTTRRVGKDEYYAEVN